MGEERAGVAKETGAPSGERGTGKRDLGGTLVHAVLAAAGGGARPAVAHAGHPAHRRAGAQEPGAGVGRGLEGSFFSGWGRVRAV